MEIKQSLLSLIENDQEKFYRIAFSYVKNREDALDILHNAVVKALQTWFYRILVNESVTFLRKNKKWIPLDGLTGGEPAQSEPGRERYIDLYSEIDRLPPKLKTILILRYFEDMQFHTIAEITATNESTVKSRLYKALKILRIHLEDIENG